MVQWNGLKFWRLEISESGKAMDSLEGDCKVASICCTTAVNMKPLATTIASVVVVPVTKV